MCRRGGLYVLQVYVIKGFWKEDGEQHLVEWEYRNINKTNHILLIC